MHHPLINSHTAIDFTMQNYIHFFKIPKISNAILPNRYQALVYLFECIFHADSKYSNDIW